MRLGGEMDITSDFGSDIPGSNPGRGTRNTNARHGMMSHMRIWFSGRMPACQVGDGSPILPIRTTTSRKQGLKYPNVVVDKGVHTGDKGQGTFTRVCEIVSE